MKRKTRLIIGGFSLLLGAVVLSGCTASFCTVTDKAHMLYAYDYGVTDYRAADADTQAIAYINGNPVTLDNVKYKGFSADDSQARAQIYEYCSTFKSIDESASGDGVKLPTIKFLTTLDSVVLGHAIEYAYVNPDLKARWNLTSIENAATELTTDSVLRDYTDKNAKPEDKGILDVYGYLKFEDSYNEKLVLWTNYDKYVEEVKGYIGVDEVPSSDYFDLYYKKTMNSAVTNARSCLTITTGDYGSYGPRGAAVQIEAKKWTDWKGLFEFLLVWPIGALLDVLTKGFFGAGVGNGWAQLLSILVVTFLIRGLMMVFTIKQSSASAKMNELQPEIQKIQAKYPNSNTNQYDKQRMAQDMQKLYKKHHINPLSSLLVMIVQFPVFICVWGAMQGNAYLSSGALFNVLRFSDSISSALFNKAAWSTGAAEVALGLFLVMSGAQTVAMLLPQWIQKKKAKDAVKLGKNPAQQQNNNRMKWFTYIMLAMIIFMGFSLASGMGIYWLFGAIFSVCQTLIMQAITARKAREQKYGSSRESVSAKKKER